MKKPVIEFQNFSFQYYSQAEPTLKNINLTIYEGEKVLICGPSGSGKSTIGHCINGLIPHSYKGEISGSLNIMGKDASTLNIFERCENGRHGAAGHRRAIHRFNRRGRYRL